MGRRYLGGPCELEIVWSIRLNNGLYNFGGPAFLEFFFLWGFHFSLKYYANLVEGPLGGGS